MQTSTQRKLNQTVGCNLFFLMSTAKFDKKVSVGDLKGSQRTSNQGLCDIWAHKRSLKRQLFQREMPKRANAISTPSLSVRNGKTRGYVGWIRCP